MGTCQIFLVLWILFYNLKIVKTQKYKESKLASIQKLIRLNSFPAGVGTINLMPLRLLSLA